VALAPNPGDGLDVSRAFVGFQVASPGPVPEPTGLFYAVAAAVARQVNARPSGSYCQVINVLD
jgi:hypothetical protein